MVDQPSSNEPVKMTREVVDRLFSQLDALQARVDHVIEKQVQQGFHLDEQDRQRSVMWKRVDDVAAVQEKTLELAEKTAETVSTLDSTLKKHTPGLEWSTFFRNSTRLIGTLSLGAAITALTGWLVVWIVNHGAAIVGWFKKGTE